MKFMKTFFIFFIVFSITMGATIKWYLDKDDAEKKIEVQKENTEELEEKMDKERINILVLGIDALDGKYAQNTSRTDTMMIFSMDPKTNSAFLLSIPRDSRVKIRNYGVNKINHAHAYGGVDLSIKTIKDLLQIPIHHYVRIDYRALFKTIDDIGGIEIDVPVDMKYTDPYAKPPLHINLKKGPQILDGQKAMQYLRFRSYGGMPDITRIGAQQNFVQKVIEKILSPASITRIPRYVDTLYTYVDTDMSKKDMLQLAVDGAKLDPSKLQKATLSGTGKTIGDISYYILDEAKMKEDIALLLAGKYSLNPQTAQTGESETSSEPSPKEQVPEETKPEEPKPPVEEKPPVIVVLNGSGKNGMARKAADLLKISEIPVNNTGNADNFGYKSTLIFHRGNQSLAEAIQGVLGKGQLIEDPAKMDQYKMDVLVVIGRDF